MLTVGIMSAKEAVSQNHGTPVRDHSDCHVLGSSHLARWGGKGLKPQALLPRGSSLVTGPGSESPGSAAQRRSSLVTGPGSESPGSAAQRRFAGDGACFLLKKVPSMVSPSEEGPF